MVKLVKACRDAKINNILRSYANDFDPMATTLSTNYLCMSLENLHGRWWMLGRNWFEMQQNDLQIIDKSLTAQEYRKWLIKGFEVIRRLGKCYKTIRLKSVHVQLYYRLSLKKDNYCVRVHVIWVSN